MFVRVKEFFWRYRWEVAGFLVLFFVLFANRFPEGYVIAGEDTFQRINLGEHYPTLFYDDWLGRVSLFYGIFYLLDRLGVSETAQLSWYLGIFLVGSYLSFLGFVRLIFGEVQRWIAASSGLFYALNLYTLYVFTYTWGFSHYQILYVFIPILAGTYITYLRTWQGRHAALFLLFLFLASSGFSNPAFAVSLGVFLFLLTLLSALARLIVLNRTTLVRIFALGIFSVGVSAYWILPTLPQVNKGLTDLAETNSIDLNWWLQKTSTPISETLRLGQFNSGSFFPRNNPYTDADFIKPLFLVLSFLPIVVILLGAWLAELPNARHRKLFWVFFGVFVLFIALNARVRYPFQGLNNFLFHLPGFNSLRSYEKIAIFTPFFIAALLTLSSMRLWSRRSTYSLIMALAIIFILPLPYYAGKLQQNMSFILAQRSKDYRKSTHSFLVKIPEPYYDIQKIINTGGPPFKIASLPYNTNKIGWVSYPKWKMRGSDITSALYTAPLINPNSAYLGQWFFARDFNEQHEDPVWLIRWLGLLNTKYIIYHKDVNEEFIRQSLEKMEYLEASGAISEVVSNEYFSLYEIAPGYVAPYVSLQGEKPLLKNYSLQEVLEKGETIRGQWEDIGYQTIHPRKFVVFLPDDLSGKNLVLSEHPDPLWRAVYHNGREHATLKRENTVIHANAWRLDEHMKNGSVTIEYLPMRLFLIGAWVSGGTLTLLIVYLVYDFSVRKRKNR